jgi:hypothetical protein
MMNVNTLSALVDEAAPLWQTVLAKVAAMALTS